MTELSLTDDQLERLREIADELEDAYVGPYGSIRTEDAVDYLIDTYTPPEDADAEAEPAVDAADAADGDSGDDGSDAGDAGDDAGDAADDGSEGDAADEGTEGDGNDNEGEADDGDGTEMPTDATSDGGAAQLQSMMSMLDDFDDKWRKAQSGEEPYEVDLPEGGTESARTKDDVRRVLFQHYR